MAAECTAFGTGRGQTISNEIHSVFHDDKREGEKRQERLIYVVLLRKGGIECVGAGRTRQGPRVLYVGWSGKALGRGTFEQRPEQVKG